MYMGGGITSIESDVVLKNLTISQNIGGGIVSRRSRVTLENVTVTENTSYEGAGVCIRGDESAPAFSETIVENVKIVDNSSEWGGGIYVSSSKLSLKDAQIMGNSATVGGGLFLAGSDAVLQNVLIANNRAKEGGGGIQNEESDLRLINVTLSDNTGGPGVGIRDLSAHSSIDLVNSIMWNNSHSEIYVFITGSVTAAHSNIYGERDYIGGENLELNWLDHNLNLDPSFMDPLNGDYRLQVGSPCIDAGVQDTLFVYNGGQDTLFISPIEYFGAAPDIGAFEYNPLDIERDKAADIPDRYELWQNHPNPFNATTVIEFSLPKDERVKIVLYNLLGQSVDTIVDQKLSAGRHHIRIPAENLSSGVYLYEMRTETFVGRKKMIVIR